MAIADLEWPVSKGAERRLRSVTPLIVDDGCDVRLRGGRHADVVRVALLEWLPLTRGDLLVVELEDGRDTPVDALATLVRPPTIWRAGEALLAAEHVGRERGTGRARHEALAEYSFTRLEEEHLERLRGVAARFAQQLPFEGLPRASDTVASGCAAVADDDDVCAAVAAAQLTRYAMSTFVARRRRRATPTMT